MAAIVREKAAPSSALLTALGALPAQTLDLVDVVQVDIDEAPTVMDELRVSYEPELLLFEAGRIVERSDGEMDAAQVASFVEHALAPR